MSLNHKIENILILKKMGGQAYWLQQSLNDCVDETDAVIHHLHPSYIMARIRVNPKGTPFLSPADLSYPPQGIAGQGRANPKGTSLFYAASCERRKVKPHGRWEQVTDLNYGLSIALYETLFELRKNAFTSSLPQTGGEQEEKTFFISEQINLEETEVSFGYWQVKDTMNLIKSAPFQLYDHDTYDQFQCKSMLIHLRSKTDPIRAIKNHEFWQFMSGQFAKLGMKENNPIDYQLSSLVANKYISDGYDGVCFPSVRSGGWGINFAITPEAVNNKLQPISVGHAKVEANGGKLKITTLSEKPINKEISPRMLTSGEHLLADLEKIKSRP